MPTNNFPGIGYTSLGFTKNYFNKLTITNTGTYGSTTVSGQQPDLIITFPTQGILISNEDASAVIRVSQNGQTDAFELDPSYLKAIVIDSIMVSCLWFRIVSGGASANITVAAWAVPA